MRVVDVIREPVRVLFHLNGLTVVVYDRREVAERVYRPEFEIPTGLIPGHLRAIGSRFLFEFQPLPRGRDLSADEMREHDVRTTHVVDLEELGTEQDSST